MGFVQDNMPQIGLAQEASSCLLLIYDHNNFHVDPLKELRGSYKRGDIVEVMDGSKHDGNFIANPIAPPFYMIRLIGVTKTQAIKYQGPHIDPATVGTENEVTLQRRKFNIEIDSLPLGTRTSLEANRYVELNFAEIRSQVRNKMTAETE